jgi:RimJ/RimL family protein N-acetyltransferase
MNDQPHPLLQGLPLPAGPVHLRALRASDAPAFLSYRSDPVVARFQGWALMGEAAALAFLQDAAPAPWTVGAWAQIGIATTEDDLLVGDIGLLLEAPRQVQIGFSLARPAQGRGWAYAAVHTCIDGLLRPLRLRRVRAITDERNAPSRRLLQRLHFAESAREAAVVKGEACIDLVFERVLDEPGAADGPDLSR